jgi:hypothetical protein
LYPAASRRLRGQLIGLLAGAVAVALAVGGTYPGVIAAYSLKADGVTLHGAHSYLDGPSKLVMTKVTSQAAAISETDLRKIVDTIKFV